MLKRFHRALKKIATEKDRFDPTQFGDDLANQISWKPARSVGINFRVRKLIIEEPHLAKFRITAGAILFGLFFMLMFTCIPSAIVLANLPKQSDGTLTIDSRLLPLVVGPAISFTGILFIYFQLTPIRFDKKAGYFRKGRKAAKVGMHQKTDFSIGLVELNDVHALQLLAKTFGRSGTDQSYELNLVLKTGQRLNVVTQGGRTRMQKDASTLSQFLEVPLWDASRFVIGRWKQMPTQKIEF